jgi:hypothetical protein
LSAKAVDAFLPSLIGQGQPVNARNICIFFIQKDSVSSNQDVAPFLLLVKFVYKERYFCLDQINCGLYSFCPNEAQLR